MKIGKLVNVTTAEAGGLIVYLGGTKVLYRDIPLLSETQIPEVLDEFERNDCDAVLFDEGAIFDVPAYDLAVRCVEKLKTRKNGKALKVVIYNAPEL